MGVTNLPLTLTGDLTQAVFETLSACDVVAMDTETSGLDWRGDELQLCQIYSAETGPILLRKVTERPELLGRLLQSDLVTKVFHFAPFDLRFLESQWDVRARRVACTKAASKLLSPEISNSEHSLAELSSRHLGIRLDKGPVRTSDWGASSLSAQQVAYAVADVAHLPTLHHVLLQELHRTELYELWRAVCDYMPVDAHLDVMGFSNPLMY